MLVRAGRFSRGFYEWLYSGQEALSWAKARPLQAFVLPESVRHGGMTALVDSFKLSSQREPYKWGL